MMSEITYRQIKKDEFKPCNELNFEAFKDYPVYHVFEMEPEEKLNNFNKSLMGCQLYEGLVKDTAFVAERDNEILSVAVIQRPDHKGSSVPEYFLYGAFSVIRYGGFKNTFGFLDMVDRFNVPHVEFAKKNPNTWNLELLFVNKKYHGQGIGSRMINECVVPYVKKNGGEYLTLITNKEKNVHFYEKNGFDILQHDDLIYNNKQINNWTFIRNFKD